MNIESRVSKIEKELCYHSREIPPAKRLYVVSSTTSEEKKLKIERIKASIMKEYGATEGVLFVDTGIVRPCE